jgi:hypothetical protein
LALKLDIVSGGWDLKKYLVEAVSGCGSKFSLKTLKNESSLSTSTIASFIFIIKLRLKQWLPDPFSSEQDC